MNPPNVTAASLTVVQQLASQTATEIHNAAHNVVTTVAAGSTVHDFVTVTSPGNAAPTGNVTFDWFLNGTCTGSPAATSAPVALGGTGSADATGFPQGPLAAGAYSFKAHYLGDSTYTPSDGACEPLQVVDADIQISPDGTNKVGDTHTFTGHVNVNLGSGSQNAPDGTTISFVVNSGPGVFDAVPAQCQTAGGTGSCTIGLTSNTPGVTSVSASTTLLVAGVSLSRTTNGSAPNSGPATKTWVDARITVSANGTNKVGDPHTFTVLVEKNDGTGWTPAENVAVTSTESGVGSITGGTCGAPNTGPTSPAGTCTIIVNSNAAGVSTVQASGTVTIGTVSIPVATNGYGAHDIQNTKTWVDARITISQSGTNPVGQAHTFTVTVEKNLGSGWVAANGVTITSTTNFGNITGGTCGPTGPTNASGQCTVTVNSNTAGTATVNASGTVAIGAINIAVATNGYGAHDISNQKTWVSQSVTTQVHNTSHTDITNTSVAAPATVHDQVTVTTSSGPGSGTVDFTLFRSNNCTGTVEGTWNDIALDGTGKAETPAVTLNPASTTSYSYLAHYDGNGPNFPAANAACEPFTLTASALLPCPAGLYLAGLTNTTPTGDLKVAYDQFPAPNDNSYGANSIGWGSHDRAFKHLLNSDHAGFLVLRPNGTTALSFDIDYITKTAVGNTPSGYASLGPFGGDGLVRTGTLTAADIQYDSSMARNLNRTGYFVGGVQTNATKTGTNSADLLVDSPPAFSTIDNATGQYILKTPNPWSGTYVNEEYDTVDTTGVPSNFYVKNVTGWNFHNTYFVTLKAGKLNALGFDRANWTFAQFSQRAQKCPGKWCVVPNDEQLHNSPAKVCPVTTAALSMRAKS